MAPWMRYKSSVMVEFDKVATGERTPGLRQAATHHETVEIDRREAETRP